MKSPIIYYGGKTSMLPVILPMIPPHEVYTEAFAGGCAVLFAKRKAKNETINDQLDIVVNFYSELKLNFAPLKNMIEATIFSRNQHDKARLIIGNKKIFTPTEIAWAFWMTCNFSYGNKIGGGLKYSNMMSLVGPDQMRNKKREFTEALVKRIEGLYIENRDALQILESRNVDKAFHYIDPPYPGANQGHYKGYTMESFVSLLEWAQTCRGKFLISNFMSPELDDYIKRNSWNFSSHTFNNKGMRKFDRAKNEILVWNYDLPNKQLF